ncbi:MAG TPA: nuclear transport factor 2 family protein [Anaerolineae bacterium]|nr:nuclear transport factor 2 family protein [Anaerolineae bacterium]
MKALVIAVMMSVVLLALPLALSAQEPDPMSIINDWVEALNAGDIDAALSYLADDAVVQIVPPAPGTSGVFSGKGEIRGWYETVVGQHGVTTLSDCQVDGETVTCVNTYAEDSFRSLGIDSVIGEWVAIVREGKLQSYMFTMSEESLAALMAAMTPPVVPETGGSAVPIYAVVAILGGLTGVSGLGMRMLQWRQRQAG